MRTVFGVVLIGVVLAACGPTHGGPQTGSGDKLYEAIVSHGAQAIFVIDSKTHATERRLPLGTPSRDWKHLYSMVGDSLVDTDPLTGNTQNALPLGARFQLPLATNTGLPGGVSAAGYWLVVQAQDATTTRMLVIDTSRFKVTDRIELPGRFDFDAISDDGQRLYLIQYLNGREYYVRLYNLAANSLDANIVVDKSDGNQAMAGLRLSGLAAPDGSMLFSMYVRESESPFIHALNLSGPFAFCLDLPGRGYTQSKSDMQWSLAMKGDGSRLYAINGATGVVAELDTSNQFSPQLLRTAQVDTGAAGGIASRAAVLTADGKVLVSAGRSGLVWIDTSSLRVRMLSLAEWRVESLALNADGTTLYAVNQDGQVAQISTQISGQFGAVAARFDPGSGSPIALMRVASA